MRPPKTYRTEAVVLKRTKLREADSLVTLYTPHYGKVRAVAKGAFRPKSRLRGHVEPLIYSQVQLVRGQNLDTVTQGDTLESFIPLRSNLLAMSHAVYVAELVDRFSPEGEPNRALFELLVNTLRRLCRTHDESVLPLHFELHLLHNLGYRPELHKCVGCNADVTPTTNFFSIPEGGIVCPTCRKSHPVVRPLSVDALKVLRFLQHNDYPTAQRVRITPEVSLSLQPLLHGYIHYLLDHSVRSTTWLDQVRRQTPQVSE